MENKHLGGQFSRRSFIAGLAITPFALSALYGCSASGGSKGASEGLTMLTASTNYKAFSEGLTSANSDVALDMISYRGYNTSDYIKAQMIAEDCPDIVINTFPNSDELQKNNLLDLSGEDFINNVRAKLLEQVSVDGAVYLIPSNISFFGPYYNKTLFEKNGWNVPTSLEELEALTPKIKAAGATVSEVTSTLPGSSFAMFWDILAPEFTSTLEGMTWMEKFLAGETKATGTLEPHLATLQRWKDAGMLNIDPNGKSDAEPTDRFKKGNTAFLTTVSNQGFFQNEDGTGDEYRIMPWLSADGSNNIIVTNVSRYYGLNKKLEDDSGKLEKALKLMGFLGSSEGQQALITASNTISPLKNDSVEEDNPLHEAAQLVDEGKSMAMVYSGWENYVAKMGSIVYQFFIDKISGTEMLAQFDQLQAEVVAAGGTEKLAEVGENLEIEQTAQLCGAAFAQAAGADCALISLGEFHDFDKENSYGCNGKLYKDVTLDENIVCSINPLGWKQLINTMELDGKTIKEWAEAGFYVEGDETPFPYILVTKEGEELDDDTTYKVACVTEFGERATTGNLTATELVGQDVLIDYIKKLETVDSSSIAWK